MSQASGYGLKAKVFTADMNKERDVDKLNSDLKELLESAESVASVDQWVTQGMPCDMGGRRLIGVAPMLIVSVWYRAGKDEKGASDGR